MLLIMQPKMLLIFFALRHIAVSWSTWCPTRTPRVFSGKLLSSPSVPSLYWCIGLFLSSCIFNISLCWLSWDFSLPIFPDQQGLSERQNNHLVNHFSRIFTISKLAEGTLCPYVICVINKNTTQSLSQYQHCGTVLLICLLLYFMLLITILWSQQFI